ncbi:antitoxin Xre/MbcA/ParS toxin-binding domain-containing protein [Legionella dresdenensis]|uniref:Antitoxin Xre/MbcA/ParS toxin-binding domain-containing protein n=1 Tax=Legionella dresdenensis TaxID=450200 RepID=A0ABV8CEC5_9GAMM
MQVSTNQINNIPDEVVWKSLINLVDRFDLKEGEARILMGDMPRSTYTSHKSRLNRDQRERVSYLLGIYKSLRILFDDEVQARTWINRKNTLPPFNGLTPKEYMLEGGIVRLAEVRRFLDFWRGY